MSIEKIQTRIKIPNVFTYEDSRDITDCYTGWTVKQQISGYGYNNTYEVYQYYVNGIRESVNDEPSYIETWARQKDKIYRVMWHNQDKKHRIGGPAVMYLQDYENEYYINGLWMNETNYWSSSEVVQHKFNSIIKL